MNARLFFLLCCLALAGCSDNPAEADPAAVSAQASSPAQVYTGQPVSFSASCNAPDGLSGVTLMYEGPDETFTRTEAPTGTRFSESFTKTYENEGVASLEIRCSSVEGVSNQAVTNTSIEQFLTNLSLELRNAATGELQEGFVYVNGDSIHTPNGLLELGITNPSVTSLQAGLIDSQGRFGSYLREASFTPGSSSDADLYMFDFLLRNTAGDVVGELARTGYDINGPMDVNRFKFHLENNILRNGMIPRYKNLVPEKFVFTNGVHSEVTGSSGVFQVNSEADLIFEKYKRQHEEIIQPLLAKEVPFERIDSYTIHGYGYQELSQEIKDIVVLGSSPNINALALVALFRDGARNTGAHITFRDKIPDKEINQAARDAFLNYIFLHEIYSALVHDSRPGVEDGVRPGDTILIDEGSLLNEISLYDIKALRELSQNARLEQDTRDYLIIPSGL